MTDLTINTDILSSVQLQTYLGSADYRIRVGFRVALEALGLPLPDYAARRPSGPKPGKAIAAAFAADAVIHGDIAYTASGNRRLGNTLPPSRFDLAAARLETISRTQRPDDSIPIDDRPAMLTGPHLYRG